MDKRYLLFIAIVGIILIFYNTNNHSETSTNVSRTEALNKKVQHLADSLEADLSWQIAIEQMSSERGYGNVRVLDFQRLWSQQEIFFIGQVEDARELGGGDLEITLTHPFRITPNFLMYTPAVRLRCAGDLTLPVIEEIDEYRFGPRTWIYTVASIDNVEARYINNHNYFLGFGNCLEIGSFSYD